MRRLLSISALILILLSGCVTSPNKNTIYQVSTVNALLAGNYDSNLKYKSVLQHGNFGIGVFNSLDGEMVLLDGNLYHINSEGKTHKPKGRQ